MKYLLFILIVFTGFVRAQNPMAGSGNCLVLNGQTDYIDLDQPTFNNYSLPISITAWVRVDPNSTGVQPIFSSNDQNSINNGIHFWLNDTSFNAGYSDGQSGTFEQHTRYKTYISDTLKGEWMHVGAVITSGNIDLYLNGIQLGGSYENNNIQPGTSLSGIPVIGRKTNGSNTDFFAGSIDEICIWSKALSPVDIRNTMCVKLNGNYPDLTRYFRLDQTGGPSLLDRSANNKSAQAMGSPAFVKSGAALGDGSSYVYQTGSWNGYVHTFSTTNQNQFKVKNVKNDPDGLHIYTVGSTPNSYSNLDWICAERGYVGVFICRQNTDDYKYDFEYNYNSNTAVNNYIPNPADIGLKYRRENDSINWLNKVASSPPNRNIVLTSEITRNEYALSGVHQPLAQPISDTTSCLDSIVFTIPFHPVYTYLWSNGSTSNSAVYRTSGTHWLSYGDSCGTFTITDTFNVNIGFSNLDIGNDTTLCLGDTLLLSTGLTLGDHIWQDGSTNNFYEVTSPGTYWVTATYGPCSGGDTVVISYESVVPFSLGNDTSFCRGDSIYLDASTSGASTYSWSTGATTPGIWASLSGNYNVVAGTLGCFESSSINLTVHLDDLRYSPDTVLCTGQSTYLWVSGASSQVWDSGETNDTIWVFPSSPTLYTVTVTEAFCSEVISIYVDVVDKIAVADFTYELDVCKGSVQFNNASTDAKSYEWRFGDGNTSMDENPVHSYEQGGVFYTTLIASANGCYDTLTQRIDVIKLVDILYISDAFTPNADGNNDELEIKGSESCFIEPELFIYNRWGEQVFHTMDPFHKFWDGSFKGGEVPQGNYSYVFRYKFISPDAEEGNYSGSEREIHGFILVLK